MNLEPIGELPPVVGEAIKNAQGELTMTVKYVSPDAVRRTLLSWAFITLFARFGYSYALSAASRSVREELFLGASSLGRHYVVAYQALGIPLSMPEPVLNMLSTGAQTDGSHDFLIAALGVKFGPIATVLMPLAGDPTGTRIRTIDTYRREDGHLKQPVVPVPFADLFESFRGVSHLGGRCRYALQEQGSLLELVAATRAEVEQTLKDARVPPPPSPRSLKPTIDDDWQSRVPNLATTIAIDWVADASKDLLRRLTDAGLETQAAQVERLPVALEPLPFIDEIAAVVPFHLAEHVRDSYAVLVEKRQVTDLSSEEALGQVREQINSQPEGPAISGRYSEFAAASDLQIAAHAMVFAVDGRELIVGPFYSVRTMILAVRELLPAWINAALKDSGSNSQRCALRPRRGGAGGC